ncbi:PA14 domain-containing protein [Taibaiella helva]|uniref:PA14 domain-containing protein n=1 Tax=Taibaiella helva TaxID=2301235 RepID=UPI000E5720E5|nr:PA14 domain-containing protein [Taibaiella helva]
MNQPFQNTNLFRRRFLLAVCFLHTSFFTFAQTGPHDFEFWFGVPQWGTGYKSPQQIHFTGSGTDTSYYEIDMPAEASFAPIAGAVPPGSSGIVNMTSFISQIETVPADAVVNRGLRIRIWGKMGAYYANETGNNYGTLPLRGPNALGTDFIVPGQNVYANGATYTPGVSSFVVTATEDNTVVTIVPTQPIIGHGANVPFTITLNRGQSYQAANTVKTGVHLAGSTISANNLVVVSYVDDLIATGGPADNGGDQLIPVTGLGTDYVHIRTSLTIPERVFLTGIYNGTEVTINNGTSTTTLILDKGELKSYALPAGINAAYIHSTKSISAYQLGGSGGELGSGILTPVVDCKGTDIVAFQRPASASTTFFNIIVPAGYESNFLLNGSATIVTAADFLDVPGYAGWKYCRKNVTSTFTAGQTIIIKNTGSKFFFYQNLYSAAGGGGGDFSNFSDFGNLLAYPKVTRDCGTGIITLDSRSVAYNATITNHVWTAPDGDTLALGNTLSAITLAGVAASDTGWYHVRIYGDNGCSIVDSMHVSLPVDSVTIVRNPSSACEGSSVLFNSRVTPGAAITGISWTGPNGFTSNTAGFNLLNATAANSGTYICRYYDAYGCYVEDSTSLTVNAASSIPEFTINGNDLLSCDDTATTLSVAGYIPGLAYRTFTGYTAPSLLASNNFDAVTTGFYSQLPATRGAVSQPNLSGLTGITAASNNFGIKYKGFIHIDTAGAYTFYLNSYDGSNLYIDGAQVVSNDGTHALAEVSGNVTLSRGYHAIETNYFTGSAAAAAALTVSWQGPAIAKAPLPASVLFMPGGTAPAGLSYLWINETTGDTVGTGASLSVTTPGAYRLVADNGCASFKFYQVEKAVSYDYSDLPSPWPAAQAGTAGCTTAGGAPLAAHAVWAGNAISVEWAHGTFVEEDSYDDGLSNASTSLTRGDTSTFSVLLNSNTAGKTVYYGLWFDWNNNGDFTDDYETPGGNRAFYSGNGIVTVAGTPSSQNVDVLIPGGALPAYKTRLIVSDVPLSFADYDNIFAVGEVEDYGASVPLPVLISDFNAAKVQEGVRLLWHVGTENKVSHYAVEWSDDGKEFAFIGRRDATGLKSYEYIHTTPRRGLNYYRIKTTDLDGSVAYSMIRTIQVDVAPADQLSVSPNPLGADKRVKLAINSSMQANAMVSVTDQSGRQVYTSKIAVQEGRNETIIQLKGMPAGMYYLRLRSGNTALDVLPAQKIVIVK